MTFHLQIKPAACLSHSKLSKRKHVQRFMRVNDHVHCGGRDHRHWPHTIMCTQALSEDHSGWPSSKSEETAPGRPAGKQVYHKVGKHIQVIP